MSMMTILELECWRASSNQVVKWLKVSLLLKQAQNHIDETENIFPCKMVNVVLPLAIFTTI